MELTLSIAYLLFMTVGIVLFGCFYVSFVRNKKITSKSVSYAIYGSVSFSIMNVCHMFYDIVFFGIFAIALLVMAAMFVAVRNTFLKLEKDE